MSELALRVCLLALELAAASLSSSSECKTIINPIFTQNGIWALKTSHVSARFAANSLGSQTQFESSSYSAKAAIHILSSNCCQVSSQRTFSSKGESLL